MQRGVKGGEDRRCCIMCMDHEGRRCGMGEGPYGAILGHHRMASVGDEGGLTRVVGGCRMRTRLVLGGENIARPSTILSRKIGAVVSRGGCHWLP